MKNIFKSVVVFAALLNLILWGLPYIDYLWLSPEVLHLLDWDGYGAILPKSDVLYWVLLALWLLSLMGLFYFNAVARKVFLSLIVLSICLAPLWGYRVNTPAESLISFLMALSYGFIVAVAYLSNLAHEFEQRNKSMGS